MTTTYYSSFQPLEGNPGVKGSATFVPVSVPVTLFRRSSTPLTAADKPNGPVIYNYMTAETDVSAVTNGWTPRNPPGIDTIYMVTYTVTGSQQTVTINTADWSTPEVLILRPQDGAAGAAGLNNASVFIYRRSASAPALPTASTTYTFATGALTGLNNGWTTTVPAGTDPLYVAVAAASSASATDTIAANEWSSPVILARDGATGAAGLNSAAVFIYKRAAAQVS